MDDEDAPESPRSERTAGIGKKTILPPRPTRVLRQGVMSGRRRRIGRVMDAWVQLEDVLAAPAPALIWLPTTSTDEQTCQRPGEQMGEAVHRPTSDTHNSCDNIPGVRTAYRADVDGLRAVAVISVVAYHLDHAILPGGFTGVDIFFVISGYVVCGSLCGPQTAHEESVGELLLSFYARRIKRLTPSLLCMVVGTTIATTMLFPPQTRYLREYYSTAQLSILGWANNKFLYQRSGYFDPGAAGLEWNPFTHCWSLGVEEQFYLCFPILLTLAYGRRLTRQGACCGVPTVWPDCRRHIPPSVLLVLTFAISFVLSFLWSTDKQGSGKGLLAFYSLPSRYWQLMSGALLSRLESTHGPLALGKGLVAMPSWLQLALVPIEAAVLLLFSITLTGEPGARSFPLPWSLIAVGATCMYIAIGSLPRRRWPCGISTPLVNSLLSTSAPVYLGKLSYPIYLFHWPTFVLARRLVPGWSDPEQSSLTKAVAVMATANMAMFAYHIVEGPFRRWRHRRRWHVFGALLPAVVAVELWLGLLKGPLLGFGYIGQGAHSATYGTRHARPPPPPPAHQHLPFLPPLAVNGSLLIDPIGRSPKPSTPTAPPALPHDQPQAPPPPPFTPSPRWPPPGPPQPPPPLPPPRCVCSNNGVTLHSPPDISPSSSTPCFEPTPISAGMHEAGFETAHIPFRDPLVDLNILG